MNMKSLIALTALTAAGAASAEVISGNTLCRIKIDSGTKNTIVAVPLVKVGIDSGCGVDAPGSFIAWLSAQTPVHAWEMPGHRYDIGNLASYEEVQRTYHGIL